MADRVKASVLVVEDDALLRDAYVSQLVEEGYQTRGVGDGEEALRELEISPPDIVLLDLMLPRIDGYEVLERVRADERLRSLPVVILSNKDDPEDIARGLAAGANGYLVKASTHHREVVWKVRECLAESKGEPVALRVAIRGSTLDAGHLAVLANQPPDLRCTTCGSALALELHPCAEQPGRFEAQLLCPHCIP